jgi:hypothetical protein
MTTRLKEAGELLGIPVVDHIVLGRGCFISMAAEPADLPAPDRNPPTSPRPPRRPPDAPAAPPA